MAVIKADGYGHGIELAATALASADEFAVSSIDDVATLRELGVTKPLTMLSAQFSSQELERLDNLVSLTIFDQHQLAALAQLKSNVKFKVWLKVDTGMGRLGYPPAQVALVYEQLMHCKSVSEIGLMSHLANADHPELTANQQQFELLDQLSNDFEFSEVSVLNSGGVCAFPQHCHQRVRPGLMLYGASPLTSENAASLGLRPAMTLSANLISIKQLPKGSFIGYGGSYQLTQDTRLGIVACGYGDGYPRHARNGTPVLVNGQRAALVGRVSMDMLAIDLNQVAAQVGDRAILWGAGNPIEEVAEFSGTIAYELMCGITSRVHRGIING